MKSRAQSFVRLCTIISETRCHFYNHWWDNLNFPCYCWILTLSVWFYCGYSSIIVFSKDASSKLTVCFYWLYENFGLISVSSMIVPVSLMIVQSHRWLFLTFVVYRAQITYTDPTVWKTSVFWDFSGINVWIFGTSVKESRVFWGTTPSRNVPSWHPLETDA